MTRPRPGAVEAAGVVREAVRDLDVATCPPLGPAGMEFPGDAWDVIGELAGASHDMGQIAKKVATFLEGQAERPGLYEDSGRYAAAMLPAQAAVADAVNRLAEARQAFARAAAMLDRAHEAVSGLGVRDTDGGAPR